ncbi:hypothetical protein [Paracoccus albus]|uniref:hypothetical protein n=1 Tax=Paracoccus albus TaxID=3017784 RepID=UPI0022F0A1F1|nr:hypothetical protein [Paracoccus albus]WBU59407.1 hypothetical protein PAF20_11580 [Paracoccus albus]
MRSTALKQFQRLEAPGSWRSSPDEQLREVIVSIGEATLILSDPKSDEPLTHWSLPAVERTNPSLTPAIYTPAAGADDERRETLEIEEPLMIEAISRVQAAIAARRPHPGRLRNRLTLLAFVIMVVAALIWVVPALRDHAAKITPQAERERIGQAILADMVRSTGQPCREPAGEQVLTTLAQRVPMPDGTRIVVLPDGPGGAIVLPGNLTVIDSALITGEDGPEAAAGHLLTAALAARQVEPMHLVMQRQGFLDVLGLLTRGSLPAESLQGFGGDLLASPPPAPDDQTLLAGFANARIPSTPYAETLGEAAARAVPLVEADPFRSQPYPEILDERDWVTLQQICIDRD